MLNHIYLELALIVNKNIYEDGKITYQEYKTTENKILNLINKEYTNGSI